MRFLLRWSIVACICKPSQIKISSKTVFSHWSSHRVTPIRTLRTQPALGAEQVAAHFVDPRVAASTRRTAEEASLPASGSSRKRTDLTCNRVIHFPLIRSGAMASSAVSSVLYLRDAAGNDAETRTGARIYYGDAASVHEWEFRTRRRSAGKTGDQYIEATLKSL